ncbi:hypothetical protein EUX98_g2897 [Antrodiella citrinella]|uniref:TLC domain-containing protein n=1 Tax=Antrodiella citrinella TaxID=2447956 RepID=A0A4S4N684_9APHY|nr:hypothetical protein EUX98_g2897 [Antrodiella citrinella]
MNTAAAPDWLPSYAVPFVTLSYPTPRPAVPDSFPNASYHGIGVLDGYFVISCIIVMAILRDAFRLLALEPLAKWKLTRDLQRRLAKSKRGNGHANGGTTTNGDAKAVADSNGDATSGGVTSKREQHLLRRSMLRFAEQGWSVIYYLCQTAFGLLYVHRNLPTSVFNPVDVWIGYPHIPLAGPIKFYYLSQTAFYLHQILILNAEARRKDHWQMMTHHVVTIALMVGSYFCNCTRVGVLIMLLMDVADVFLPLAKMLRYLSFTTLCDITFGLFMVSWFITRHILFIVVIVSVWQHSVSDNDAAFMWNPKGGLYLTRQALQIFVYLLVCLEILQLVWFTMIIRVAWRVVSGEGAEDTRSDDEGDIDDGDDKETKKDK